MKCWEFSSIVSSSEQDHHWEQSRLLRAFPSAPWEEFLPWHPGWSRGQQDTVGQQGCELKKGAESLLEQGES